MLKKQVVKSRRVVKVTFELPRSELPDEMDVDQTYQFRYLINGEYWCNDWAADEYNPNEFGEDNCVVITPALAANTNGESDA